MRPGMALALASVLLMAGCASDNGNRPTPSPPDMDAATLPPGCDRSLVVTAHRAGGVPEGIAPEGSMACFLRTGGVSGEPNVAVSPSTGSVFIYGSGQSVNPDRALWRSNDLGATWTALPTLHPASLDPHMYLDPATNRIFVADLLATKCAALSFTDDEGATWTHTTAGCSLFDHETIFAGKPVTSTPSGYPNIVYYCAYMVGAAARAGTSAGCEKSLDGGLTWTPTSPITTSKAGPGNGGWPTCNGAVAHGTAGADGTIYVPHAQCGVPTLAISKDEGASWRNIKVSDLGMATYNNGFIDHEAGVGVDPTGNIYYVWNSPDRLPHLVISRDGGDTWSTPIQIGSPNLTQAVFPALAVGGDGKLAVVYIGSTNAPIAPFPKASCTPIQCTSEETDDAYREVTWDGHILVTTNALDEHPLFWTARVNPPEDPLFRGPCKAVACGAIGDYLDIRIGPDGTPWASFVDACKDTCVKESAAGNDASEGAVGRVIGLPSLMTE